MTTLMEGMNFFVCGKFHYHKYLPLMPKNTLGKVFFSHRRGETLGLPSNVAVNCFAKEYLQQAHGKLLGNKGLDRLQGMYHAVWRLQLWKHFLPAQTNVFLAHGASLSLMRRCKEAGGIVIAEAVNAHPDTLTHLLRTECENLGLDFSRPPSWDKISAELLYADYVLAPSSAVARSLLENGIPALKVITLSYGCLSGSGQTVHLEPRGARSPLKVLCVAQVIPRKGQVHLARAIKQLNASNFGRSVELTLVGRADVRYLTLINSTGIRYKHIGHVPNHEMMAFMRAFDVFVLPSIEDGFGNVVGEALCAGLPVVVTSKVGAADIVSCLNPALVAPPSNSAALSDAIQAAAALRCDGGAVALPGWQDYAVEMANQHRRLLNS